VEVPLPIFSDRSQAGKIKPLARQDMRHKNFDFEIGHLVKSPCKQCAMAGNLPSCANQCEKLHAIQRILSRTMSCSNGSASGEESALAMRSGDEPG